LDPVQKLDWEVRPPGTWSDSNVERKKFQWGRKQKGTGEKGRFASLLVKTPCSGREKAKCDVVQLRGVIKGEDF